MLNTWKTVPKISNHSIAKSGKLFLIAYPHCIQVIINTKEMYFWFGLVYSFTNEIICYLSFVAVLNPNDIIFLIVSNLLLSAVLTESR